MWIPSPPPAPKTATVSSGAMRAQRINLVGGDDGVADDRGLGRVVPVVDPLGDRDPIAGGELDVFGVPPVDLTADEPGQVVAQGLPTDPAPMTLAAAQVEMRGDDCTDLEAVDAVADLDDLAEHLVPDDDRVVDRRTARPGMVDGEPGAAGDHPRHCLARPRFGVRPLLQDEGFILPLQYHRFHNHLRGCDVTLIARMPAAKGRRRAASGFVPLLAFRGAEPAGLVTS